jgi:hypothetical protein
MRALAHSTFDIRIMMTHRRITVDDQHAESSTHGRLSLIAASGGVPLIMLPFFVQSGEIIMLEMGDEDWSLVMITITLLLKAIQYCKIFATPQEIAELIIEHIRSYMADEDEGSFTLRIPVLDDVDPTSGNQRSYDRTWVMAD